MGIIYYATNDDFPWITTGVTEEEAMTITDDVVRTQTQLILQDLGVGDDGVSSKITIHNTYPDNGYAGFSLGILRLQMEYNLMFKNLVLLIYIRWFIL